MKQSALSDYILPVRRSLHRMRLALHERLSSPSQKEPVFVLATPRSGSRLLISYLENLPEASFVSEVLNPHSVTGLARRTNGRESTITHIRRTLNYLPERLCGCKLLHVHMRWHDLSPADLVDHFPSARFLILYRRSTGEQALSLKMAEETGEYVRKTARPVPLLTLEPDFLMWFEADLKVFYESLALSAVIRDRSLWLTYEDLAANPQKLFEDRILPFLSHPAVRVMSSLKKQREKMPRELIFNYDEVREWFEGGRGMQDYDRVAVLIGDSNER